MAITSLTCKPAVRRWVRPPKPDYELLDAAIRSFGEGAYRRSLQETMSHLFPGQSLPDFDGAPETSPSFVFVQGSSRVTVTLSGEDLHITVPLVRLVADAKATAALRFLLTRMSGSGQLHQPRLRGDDAYLEFKDRLSRLHPIKILEVLRRMPVEADTNDDWMVDQFGVLPLDRVPIAALDNEEAAKADAIWRAHWQEIEELLKESQRKRSMFFLNEVCAFAIYHLQYAMPLTGPLLSRIAESSRTFNDADEDPMKRESALAKCIKEMKAVAPEELGKNLGHAEYSISPLVEGTPRTIASHLGTGDYIEAVGKARTLGKSMDAALALFATYNYLLARFSWPEEVENELTSGLAQASEKPWREAANTLWSHAKSMVARFSKEDEEHDGQGGATT